MTLTVGQGCHLLGGASKIVVRLTLGMVSGRTVSGEKSEARYRPRRWDMGAPGHPATAQAGGSSLRVACALGMMPPALSGR